MGTLKQCARELAISGESLETLPSGTESKAVCSRAAYLFYSSEMPSMNEPGFQRLAGWPFNRRLFFFFCHRGLCWQNTSLHPHLPCSRLLSCLEPQPMKRTTVTRQSRFFGGTIYFSFFFCSSPRRCMVSSPFARWNGS